MKYLQMLFANDKKHSKLVSNFHQNFNDQLHQSDEKLKAATEQYQNLKQDYNACLDDIKIKHHSRLWKQQILHAQVIDRKYEIVKKMWKNVERTREMLWDILEEMNKSKQRVKIASTSADIADASAQKAANRSSLPYNKLKVSTTIINESKDEISNEMKTVEEIQSKVDEHEVIIDCMEIKYKDKCNKHRTKIASIESYYQAVIAKNSPCYMMKHWVKNKTRGK
jgi:hypothetical protein